MTNDPNVEATHSSTPSPYEAPTSGAAEKPVEHVAQVLGASATEAAADQLVVRHRLSPYETGAKPDEIWREHENRVRLGLPVNPRAIGPRVAVCEICAEWKVEVPLDFLPPAQGTL